MIASDIQIEWDEDGCYITIDGDSIDPDYQAGCYRWRVENPEQLYDQVRSRILPWLRERDEARASMPAVFACNPDESAGAYEASYPKSPDFHSVHADIWDLREGK